LLYKGARCTREGNVTNTDIKNGTNIVFLVFNPILASANQRKLNLTYLNLTSLIFYKLHDFSV